MTQVNESYIRLSLLVQGQTGKTGDRLWCQRLLIPVREDHRLLALIPSVPQNLEPVRQLLADGDLPVRQYKTAVQKVHLLPGKALNLVPQQTGLPGQTENSSRRVSRVFQQGLFHGLFIWAVNDIFPHNDSPSSTLSLLQSYDANIVTNEIVKFLSCK